MKPNLADAFDFSGKHVFVAGGSSGINLAIGEAFARLGARVALASRSPERVEAAAAGLRDLGAEAAGFSADVRDPEAIRAALGGAAERFGPIDVLISGAAGNFLAPATGMSANGFRTVVDIDLNGTFNVLRGAHEFLRKPGAAILNISAPQSINPTAFQAHVCAAKAGVDMVTRVGALEWGGAGVRVNSVVPGPIDGTEGMDRLAPTEASRKAVTDSVPLGRFGTPQEIADCCLWLSSPMAAYVSGAIIPVDGGWSLGGASSLGKGF